MKYLTLIFVLVAGVASAQSVVNYVTPEWMAKPKGYSTAVTVDLGKVKMVIISGLVSYDEKGNIVGKDDMALQAEQIFKNMKRIVEGLGGKMSDVVKVTNFLTDMSKLQAFRDVRDKYVNTQNPPASSTVEVTKLVKEGLVAEVEATVMIAK